LDDAGNLATASTSGLIDLTLPELAINPLSALNSANPIISGTCDEVGATISISLTDGDGDIQSFTTTVLANNTYSIAVPDAISEGLLNVEVSVLDDAGNLATASTSGLIDLTLPELAINPLSALNSANPVISGTCDEVGATVSISLTDGDGDIQSFTTTVLANNTYSIAVPDAISEGLLNVEVSVLDDAGNLATASTSGLIDLSIPTLDIAALGLINDATPTIFGTSDEIGGTVTITTTDFAGDEQTTSAIVDENGDFETDLLFDVSEGLLNIDLSIFDAANNEATASTTATIDTIAPNLEISSFPTILSPILTGTTDTDMSGRTLNIDLAVKVLGVDVILELSTTVLANGTWSTGPIANLSVGPVSADVYIEDEAGNLATVSGSSTVTLSSSESSSTSPFNMSNETEAPVSNSSPIEQDIIKSITESAFILDV
ncbi:MAG: Ig-like domain-containing protein, partial [Aliiglaciecola sp.]|uniref:Ig-like domain-containing protein n=1 Tax=Aliiglaciecola sp. TaxID=1872441 RepID=UPI0032988F6B